MGRPPVVTLHSWRLDMFEEIKKTAAVASIVGAIVAVGAGSATAQADAEVGARSSVSVSVTQMRPVGPLSVNIGSGFGASAAFLHPLDRRGILSLRADVGISEYGDETTTVPFSETVGGRVEVAVRTSNFLVPASIGFQVTPSLGSVEPYVNVGVGAEAFFTESRVEPTTGGEALAGTTNQWDVALAWTVGGGLYLPIGSALPNVAVDIGVQYYRGATAEYLAPGGIADLPGGGLAITPMTSSTHLLALRVGARIGL
jgi:hypothetical protein